MTKIYEIINALKNFKQTTNQMVRKTQSYKEEGKFLKYFFSTLALTLAIAISRFFIGKQIVRAAALTYYTIFSLIPILAVIIAIGRGFGLDQQIANFIVKEVGTHTESISIVFDMIDSYLKQTSGGAFIGMGFVFLIWSVYRVFNQIENSFNAIWDVKKPRRLSRKFTDYFSLLLSIPFIIVITATVPYYIKLLHTEFNDNFIISPTIMGIIHLLPWVVTCFIFTMIYIIAPNTKVKFPNALFAGVLTGCAFQVFKMIYVFFQSTATNYNAVYGSLAAIPLLLIFIYSTWIILLIGAELTFAGQNVSNIEDQEEISNISYKYKDYVMLFITHKIFKNFEEGMPAMSTDYIAETYKLPTRLVKSIINKLCKSNVLYEVNSKNDKDIAYTPAMDINKVTVSSLFETIRNEGYEASHFKYDQREKHNFKSIWLYFNDAGIIDSEKGNILVKDLE